jgi:hypothetical protein
MRKFLEKFFKLDCDLSIWVEENDLGQEKTVYHQHNSYSVKIPKEIHKVVTLRLRGLGKTRLYKTGDLLLHVWLNKGEDERVSLWLPETAARSGTNKQLLTEDGIITVVIPPRSRHGLTIRLKGLGMRPGLEWNAPRLPQARRGNLLVKLFVYPDKITPIYGSFDALSTDNMVLEGWVYRKFDEVIRKLGRPVLPDCLLRADEIAELFNARGWRSIFNKLVDQFGLARLPIELESSAITSMPGRCERTTTSQGNGSTSYAYKVVIKQQFLENPFAIAAILAHELCHVVYTEKIDETPKTASYMSKSEQAKLEEERTVDLLVFIYQLGEFQLRVARDTRLTLGYFNQEVFDRIQVIVSRKSNTI